MVGITGDGEQVGRACQQHGQHEHRSANVQTVDHRFANCGKEYQYSRQRAIGLRRKCRLRKLQQGGIRLHQSAANISQNGTVGLFFGNSDLLWLWRPVFNARIRRNPIHFPGLAAIGRERLLKVARIGRDL